MEQSATACVTVEQQGVHIAIVRLSNPGRLNSFTEAMWRQLQSVVETLGERRRGVRCIVISGADSSAFAAGSDIREFRHNRATVEQARKYGGVVANALNAIEACEVPLIASIQGACVGGGLAVAALCDLRVAAVSAKFGVPVNRLGLVMAHVEMRGLLRIAGPAAVREMLLEGRIWSAQEALAAGIVTSLVAAEQVERESLLHASNIAAGAPLVARWHKRFIRRLSDPAPLTAEEVDEGYACFDTQDYRIGLHAFEDKSLPAFVGK